MTVKGDIIQKMECRLELPIEVGFPGYYAKQLVDAYRRVPLERFSDPEEIYHLANDSMRVIGGYGGGRIIQIDSMGPSEIEYLKYLRKDKNYLRSEQMEEDFKTYNGMMDTTDPTLNWQVILLNEARIPMWEHHDEVRPGKNYEFVAQVELASKYRQILFNSIWESCDYGSWFKDNIESDQLERLLSRLYDWIVDLPKEYLAKTCTTVYDHRAVGLAFKEKGGDEEARKHFREAFKISKKSRNHSLQQRLLKDMRFNGRPTHLKDRMRVRTALYFKGL